jgi:hypothetical protein
MPSNKYRKYYAFWKQAENLVRLFQIIYKYLSWKSFGGVLVSNEDK